MLKYFGSQSTEGGGEGEKKTDPEKGFSIRRPYNGKAGTVRCGRYLGTVRLTREFQLLGLQEVVEVFEMGFGKDKGKRRGKEVGIYETEREGGKKERRGMSRSISCRTCECCDLTHV